MGLPKVTIPLLNGQLGTFEAVDGKVPGLIVSGVAVTGGIGLADPRQIFALEDAEALGITEIYDRDEETDAWLQIKEFYDEAGRGAELYIMIVAKTATMASVCDIANNLAKKMLNYAEGRITYWGITRVPDSGFTLATTKGYDDDAYAAILKAQALCEDFASQFKPCRAIIGGRAFAGVVANLVNLRQNTDNRVMTLLGSSQTTYPATAADTIAAGTNVLTNAKKYVVENDTVTWDGVVRAVGYIIEAVTGKLTFSGAGVVREVYSGNYRGTAMGMVLGRMAKTPVQEKISRVRTGDLNILNAYFSSGASVMTLESAWDAIHDKGYVFFRKFVGRNGFYFTSDPTCVSEADDYSSFARGLVIDKAMRILYGASLDEIDGDNDVDEDGFIEPAYAKSLQAQLENALLLAMANEISGAEVLINPRQDVLATNKVQITKAGVRPRFYASIIDIPLGFTNPQNN
jgi:hypothetical protein